MNLSVKAVIAELVATGLFVYIGTGTATNFGSLQTASGYTLPASTRSETDPTTDVARTTLNNLSITASWGITTALAFGLAITVLVYASAHLSGGQLNPAVTLGLALAGALHPLQAAANMLAQIVGAILGSSFLMATVPHGHASALGSNSLAPGVTVGNAIVGEIVMTFVLVSVVLETCDNKRAMVKAQAPLAIGFAVFCAHAVMLPIDGCSINPARSLGPAIVSGTWPGSFWVFIVGPFVGSLFAVPLHLFFRSEWDTVKQTPKEPAVGLSPSPSDGAQQLAAAPAGPPGTDPGLASRKVTVGDDSPV